MFENPKSTKKMEANYLAQPTSKMDLNHNLVGDCGKKYELRSSKLTKLHLIKKGDSRHRPDNYL